MLVHQLPTRVAMIALAAVAVSLLIACGPTEAADSDWPQFRGPTGMGVSTDKAAPPVEWSGSKNLAWKVELPGAGTSSPVVFGQRIYITCYSGYNMPGAEGGSQDDLKRHLVALKRTTGEIIWDKTVPPKLPEQARIRDGHGYASSTVYVDKERIYTFFGKSGAFAFDHDGKQLWHAEVGDDIHTWGSAASPVVHGDLVYINASVESSSLIALDKKTGAEKWRVRGIKESWNTPILVDVKGKTELVVAMMGKILGFDPTTGDELWSCKTDIGWYMVPSLVAHDGVVYALGGRSGVAGLAVKAGGRGEVTGTHRLWTSMKGSNVSSPIYHDGHLYWMSDSKETAYCAKAATGEVVYEQPISRADQVYGSPVLAGGNIYYTNRRGTTFVVAATPKFEQRATNSFGDRSTFNCSPAVVDGRLLIRSDKYLYCVGEK